MSDGPYCRLCDHFHAGFCKAEYPSNLAALRAELAEHVGFTEGIVEERDALRAELEGARAYHESKDRLWRKAVVERTEARSLLAQAEAALEWYASDAPYRNEELDEACKEGGFFPYDCNEWAIAEDLGKKAREALTGIRAAKEGKG